ncbi:hypothetical protein P4H83_23920 [Paenibacillus favisporus]|uniref:hypothetical protein n=1 Tax=Paenibacillus TaxID=44249 RepID=UPI0011AB680C|nr:MULTISPECIES: hypothetical protein [Paenibacillus]MEC0177938.1 hypothetical protein [Paenibacillus favisporus]
MWETKGRGLGIIGSILGIVLSVFLIYWFRTDPGDIQYLVVIFFLLLPSLLASYAVIKASFSMLLIADILHEMAPILNINVIA